MVPPRRRANDPIEATGQDLDNNPNNPQENVDNINPLQVTQDDTADSTQLMRVLQESNAQVMRTMQENTRALNQFVAMFAQILPAMAAPAAAQTGATSSNPVLAAQQQPSQVPQSTNLPTASEETTTRVDEPVHVSEPVITQTPANEMRDMGVRFGGSAFSRAVPRSVTATPLTQVNFAPAAPVEATTSAQRAPFVTKEDFDTYLKEIQAKSSAGVLDLKLPYDQRIADKPYPKDYVSPKFMLFNGKRGSAKEHLLKFIETLEVYGFDDDLKLKEFSKSLTEKAYTWYVNLPPGSVDSWGTMCKMFLEKFFSTQERVTLTDMGRIRQRPKEDLMEYIERFRERSLDIQDICDERELVKICIQGMFTEYAVHLENLSLLSFATLVENARRTNNSVLRQRGGGGRFNKREPSVNSVQSEDSKAGKKPRVDKPRIGRPTETPTYPCPMGKVHAMMDQWLRDGNLKLPRVERLPTQEEKNNPKFCRFHRTVGHPTKDCFTLKRIFNERVRNGELIIEDNDVRNNPLPAHNNQRGAVNVVTHDPATIEASEAPPAESSKAKGKTVEKEQDECTPVVTALMKTSNFRNFFDLLGFDENARLAATVALTQISDGQYAECNVAQPVKRMARAHEDAILFTNADMCVSSPNHNRPLYVEGTLNGYPVKRTFIDTGSSLNIMPKTTFEAAGIDARRLVKQPISVNGFSHSSTKTIGRVNVDLKIGPVRGSVTFHVIDAPVSYHLLIGRKWLHDHNLVPSTLHQCIKGHWNGKDVFIPATKNPFEYDESYFIESTFFDEYAEEGETAIAKASGVPLPSWEEVQEDQQKKRRMRGCRAGRKKNKKNDSVESFVREDGRRVYLL